MRNSLADVVAAALRVLGEHGLEFCSMRRVAAELGVQPSALYHHVPDKQTLLALMADEIVRGVGIGIGDPRRLCVDLRRALLAVRDGADVVATAAAFRLGASEIEDRLAALVGADGARTLLLYTFGHAQSTQTRLQALAFGVLADPAPSASPTPLGATVSPGSPADAEAELDASYGRGLDIILAGLRASSALGTMEDSGLR
ncbi:MAG: TetR/AcrR family transcriptional regulator [Candidatus Leucobacter sulfamidivorax]|nr:TetR/AcrR family transcriptional regulator [Candidatus Leucobacter sulfamidivorax]